MKESRINTKEHAWEVIVNPNALSGKCVKVWDNISSNLKNLGIRYTEHLANHSNAGKTIAQNLCKNGKRHFIVIGGDGTLNEVINGVYGSGISCNEVYIVPFPVGTGNDWGRTHQYPKDYHLLFHSFCQGNFMEHDVGVVKTILSGVIADTRYFVNIAGFCFDAEVIDETTKKGKSVLFSSATYVLKLLKVLLHYKSKPLIIEWEDQVIKDTVFTIAVGIGKYNGNGMMQVPMADPFDGLFDVMVIRKISILKVVANVKNLFSGKHIHLKEARIFRTDNLDIFSESNVMGEVEGEMLTTGNYTIAMCSERVKMLKVN